MRKLTIMAAASAIFLTGATAHAATIDFQTLSDGVTTPTFLGGGSLPDHTPFLVGNEYASLGVVFSSEGDSVAELNPIFGTLSGNTGSNIVVQDYKRDVTSGSTFNIRADFAALTSFVQADVFTAAGEGVTMTVYDAGGTSLGSITSSILAAFGDSDSIGITVAGRSIAYAIWESTSPFAAAVGIDNLQFDPVPLPAAAPFMAAGLAGLGLYRRHSKKAA